MQNNRKRKFNLGDIIKKMNKESDNQHIDAQSKEHFDNRNHNERNYSRRDSNIQIIPEPFSPKKKESSEPSKSADSKNGLNSDVEIQDHQNINTNSSVTTFTQSSALSQSKEDESEAEFDLFQYVNVIIRRKEIIILATLIAVFFSVIATLKSTKYYRTRARLLFKPFQSSILGNERAYGWYQDRERNLNTHLELLKSNIVLERVLRNLEDISGIGVISSNLMVSHGQIEGKETNIIELNYSHPDAVAARDVLNELCRTYIEYIREVNAQEDSRLIVKLKIQIDKVQKELDRKESTFRKFKEDYRMVNLSNEANIILRKLSNVEVELQQTQLSLLGSKERLSTLRSQIKNQEATVIASMGYENPMLGKLTSLELELNTLLGEYSPDHYKVKQINQKIENLKKAMQSEIKKEITEKAIRHTLVKNPIRESLLQSIIDQTVEISVLEAKRIALEQINEKLNLQMNKIPLIEQEYGHLQRETESLLKTLRMLKVKYEEAKIKRDSKESEIKILELAKLPRTAISKKRFSSIYINIVIGIIIGIALAFLFEYIDQSIKDPSAVEKQLELPLIGIVPMIESSNAVVDENDFKKSMLEPFRSLRANIKYISNQHNAKIFMVCSAIKGEGKTTLTTNLAITFAMDGKKTIIVDADLRRSQIHSLLNIPKELGLSDYIQSQKNIDEIIKPTRYKNLCAITSGERPNNPAELLGTQKFICVLNELRKKADIILIDSPAIIPVSDSMTMAPYMDCCLMITRAFWTPVKAAKQAKNQLSRIKTNLIGCVLNGLSHSRGYYPYYYGYYGYYAYKYTYDYDETPRKKTFRELGLSFDSFIKSSVQSGVIKTRRGIAKIGLFLSDISKKVAFWIMLLVLISLFITRQYLIPSNNNNKNNDTSITYLGQMYGKEIDKQKKADFNIINFIVNISDVFDKTQNRSEEKNSSTDPMNNKYSPVNFIENGFNFRDSLVIWKKAFNASNEKRFLQFYHKQDFEYPGGTYTEWQKKIKIKLLNSSNNYSIISFKIQSIKKVKTNYYETTCNTTVRSDQEIKTVNKTMIWKLNNNRWRIIREKDKLLQ